MLETHTALMWVVGIVLTAFAIGSACAGMMFYLAARAPAESELWREDDDR